MIISNPDEQVWNMLTGGLGSAPARKEADRLKKMLQEKKIRFVVDNDERFHWIRLRSRKDLMIIHVKADITKKEGNDLLQISCGKEVFYVGTAEEAMKLVMNYYGEEPAVEEAEPKQE